MKNENVQEEINYLKQRLSKLENELDTELIEKNENLCFNFSLSVNLDIQVDTLYELYGNPSGFSDREALMDFWTESLMEDLSWELTLKELPLYRLNSKLTILDVNV